MKNEYSSTTTNTSPDPRVHGILGLTCCLTSGKMLPNKEKKERYDCGSSQTAYRQSGMDPTREAEERKREALSLCCSKIWQQGRVAIHFFPRESRKPYRGKNTCETRSYQKIKPACNWPLTIENFVAARSPTKVWTTGVNDPKRSLPIFSIHRLLPYGKVCS